MVQLSGKHAVHQARADKDFVMPLKANRKVALRLTAKHTGQWLRLDQLTLAPHTPTEIYLETVDFPLTLELPGELPNADRARKPSPSGDDQPKRPEM